MIAEVIVDISNSEVDRVFDYKIDEHSSADVGSRVLIPFGPKTQEGYVIALKEKSDYDNGKLKSILDVLDPVPVIGKEMLELMHFMTKKYHLRKVDVLRLFIPSELRGGRVKELIKEYASLTPEFRNRDPQEFIRKGAKAQSELYEYLMEVEEESVTFLNSNFSASSLRNFIMRGIVSVRKVEVFREPYKNNVAEKEKNITLTPMQSDVVNEITSTTNTPFLLHGVTGSGKTEVYMRLISDALAKNKTAIMLVPEISLTPQVLRNFRARFGDLVALLHSGLSSGERFDEWRRLLSGQARVAVGARSAVFAPVKDVGVIIIDEEHDGSYASESNPRYLTHDVALFRAKANECNLVMGSATPSIESYYKTQTGEYRLVELPQRVNKKPLPHIEVVNMCNEIYHGNNGLFSRALESKLRECIENGNQAMIFLNRRGYSSYMMCRSCGYVAKCSDCDVSLVYHKDDNALKCHYCGLRFRPLTECPECKSKYIKQGYIGTQQVVELLEKMFPTETILRMDNDTTRNKDAVVKILETFAQKKASILVGTQMIAKGHDFPDVTLVGIVDADMSLHFSDFRANERTYQLITQVAGRAGRESKSGEVVLQTYSPRHYVYKYAVTNDYKGFYEKESNLREVTNYPPYSRILRVLVSSENEELAISTLKNIFTEIGEVVDANKDSVVYYAAMKSPVKRIQTKHRVQLLMRIKDKREEITQQVYTIVDKYLNPKVSIFVEVNPNNLS
ncbi:MAG: primosomal protein N' [Clostridiales bacterium]|nr:primosomal protein N' [Clostridiales bacterium]